MPEFISQITSINVLEKNSTFEVKFWVMKKEELEIFDNSSEIEGDYFEDNNALYSMVLSFEGDSFNIIPGSTLDECMEIFEEYKEDDDLEPEKMEKWKIAFIANNMAQQIMDSNILGIWDTEEEYM